MNIYFLFVCWQYDLFQKRFKAASKETYKIQQVRANSKKHMEKNQRKTQEMEKEREKEIH